MEGWMTKKGARLTNWKRRWFVLTNDKLEYFTDTDKKSSKGVVNLKEVLEVGRILHETREWCIGLRTAKRLFVVCSEDETSFKAWLQKFLEIQPKELDSEYTNVPHSSLGNITKQLLRGSSTNKSSGVQSSDASRASASPRSAPPASPTAGTESGTENSVLNTASSASTTQDAQTTSTPGASNASNTTSFEGATYTPPRDEPPVPTSNPEHNSSKISAADTGSSATTSSTVNSPRADQSEQPASTSGNEAQADPIQPTDLNLAISTRTLSLEDSPFSEQPSSTEPAPTPVIAATSTDPADSPFE